MQEEKDRKAKFLDDFEDIRVLRGWGVSEMCRKTGITRSLYYSIRDGDRPLTTKVIQKLDNFRPQTIPRMSVIGDAARVSDVPESDYTVRRPRLTWAERRALIADIRTRLDILESDLTENDGNVYNQEN